jgi:hypothetical protein
VNLSSRIASAVAYTACPDLAGACGIGSSVGAGRTDFPTAGAAEPSLGAPYNDVARFLDEQIGRMPMPQGWGVRALALAFDLSALASHGARFHRLRQEARRERLAAWRESPLFFCRQFVRLHESLAAYRLYARLETSAPGRGS